MKRWFDYTFEEQQKAKMQKVAQQHAEVTKRENQLQQKIKTLEFRNHVAERKVCEQERTISHLKQVIQLERSHNSNVVYGLNSIINNLNSQLEHKREREACYVHFLEETLRRSQAEHKHNSLAIACKEALEEEKGSVDNPICID